MLACHFVHNRSIATFHCGYWSHWEIINWRVWANNTMLVEWRGSGIHVLSVCPYWWHWAGHCWILKLWFSTFDRIIVWESVGWYLYLHMPCASLLFSEFIDVYCIAIKLSCWSYRIIGRNPLIRWLLCHPLWSCLRILKHKIWSITEVRKYVMTYIFWKLKTWNWPWSSNFA